MQIKKKKCLSIEKRDFLKVSQLLLSLIVGLSAPCKILLVTFPQTFWTQSENSPESLNLAASRKPKQCKDKKKLLDLIYNLAEFASEYSRESRRLLCIFCKVFLYSNRPLRYINILTCSEALGIKL